MEKCPGEGIWHSHKDDAEVARWPGTYRKSHEDRSTPPGHRSSQGGPPAKHNNSYNAHVASCQNKATHITPQHRDSKEQVIRPETQHPTSLQIDIKTGCPWSVIHLIIAIKQWLKWMCQCAHLACYLLSQYRSMQMMS